MEDRIEIHGGKTARPGDRVWVETSTGWVGQIVMAIYRRKTGTVCVELHREDSMNKDQCFLYNGEEWRNWRDSPISFGMKLDENLRERLGEDWLNAGKERNGDFDDAMEEAARKFLDEVEYWEK